MATEVSPKSNRLFIVIGVILAVVAFALVLFITKNNGTSNTATQNVVVAKVDLPQGVAITADMLTMAPYPVPIPVDAQADPAGVVGQIPSVPVKANSPVTQSVLVNKQTTALGSNSLSITKGDVALSIPTSYGTAYSTAELQNVGNYIQPEDHIDVMVADAQGNIRFSFQDVRVLRVGVATAAPAAGQTTAAAPSLTPSVLIVELPRNQAELMTYLITRPPSPATGPQSALVKYVLRPRDEYGKDKQPPNYVSNAGTPMPSAPDNGAGSSQLSALFAGR